MERTLTPTLGMRLSCNFVNVYTITYRNSTRLHVYTRASLANILSKKSARVGQVGGQVGEDRRACPARGKLNGLPREDPRAEVGEDVRVGVGQWNSSFTAQANTI